MDSRVVSLYDGFEVEICVILKCEFVIVRGC